MVLTCFFLALGFYIVLITKQTKMGIFLCYVMIFHRYKENSVSEWTKSPSRMHNCKVHFHMTSFET